MALTDVDEERLPLALPNMRAIYLILAGRPHVANCVRMTRLSFFIPRSAFRDSHSALGV
jgi:hypothetical protein